MEAASTAYSFNKTGPYKSLICMFIFNVGMLVLLYLSVNLL